MAESRSYREPMHTTNYVNTLITVAPDTKALTSAAPPTGKGSVAELQFAMLQGHDYEFTSDDVVFGVFAERKGVPDDELEVARQQFFSKGQPCLRTSPLTKTYGWGVHADADGHIALFAMESEAYAELVRDDEVVKKAAMKSSR